MTQDNQNITRYAEQGAVNVVEFSLMADASAELEKKLRPYVEGNKKATNEDLIQIITDTFGRVTLDELETLTTETRNKTVYIIHNLPEISDYEAKQLFKDAPAVSRYPNKELGQTYSHYITQGIALALSLRNRAEFGVKRAVNEEHPTNDVYHNHPKMVSAIGGIVSDEATTKFLNLSELSNDPEAEKLNFQHEDLEQIAGQLVRTGPPRNRPVLMYRYHHLWTDNMEIHTDQIDPADEAIVRKYEKEITVRKGDLVLWQEGGRNMGCLMHKSVASQPLNVIHDPKEIARIISVHFMGR